MRLYSVGLSNVVLFYVHCCVVLCIVCFVSFYVLFVCKCVLPPGDNPNAVNKYINNNMLIWISRLWNSERDVQRRWLCAMVTSRSDVRYHVDIKVLQGLLAK